MPSRGRPAQGPRLVEHLDGSAVAKERLRVILETIAGTRTLEEACTELDLCRSAFCALRSRVLATALSDLEPRPLGRPPAPEPEATAADLAALQAEQERLLLDLRVAHVREEIRLVFPDLAEKDAVPRKKKLHRKVRRRSK